MPRLKLIASPVVKNDGFTLTNDSETSTNVERKPQLHTENSYSSGGQVDIGEPLPQFVKHEESTNIELFYDLFFVANLTTFSNVHEVNSRKMLTSYMGFFCILWFTWCQTSLFDIRFITDSWLERAAKACHLGVMVGLAVVGPEYDTEVHKDPVTGLVEGSESTLQTMALILCVSRFVLGIQYSHILWQVRDFRKTKLPLGLISGYNFIAALIYLIVAFAFKHREHAYRAFYVVAVAEMVVNIAVSSKWKVLSFHRTHLVERMSLLTLYILGEGVIDILKSVGAIVKVKSHWSSGTIGLLIAAIACVYFLYMLYFDCLNHKHFGSIRQQIWAFAHFPFHVALVLSLTGLAVFEKWYQVILVASPFVTEYEDQLTDAIPNVFTATDVDQIGPLSNEAFFNLSRSLNNTVQELFDKFPPLWQLTLDERDAGQYNISLGYLNGTGEAVTESKRVFFDSVSNLQATVLNSIFATYGFEAPESDGEVDIEALDTLAADFQVISVVFQYFFISAGLTLVLMGFLSLIMDTHKRWSFGTIIRSISHLVVGTAVALLAVMKGKMSQFNFESSPWILPTYALAILLVLGFHHIRWGKNDHEVETPGHMDEAAE